MLKMKGRISSMLNSDRIHVGTSGWRYDHWKGSFYPETLSQNDYLHFYSGHFPTMEINNSFYQLPSGSLLADLRDSVPDSFVFSVKANRYITYIKKLKDARMSLTPFLQRMDVLGDKLGPILFQLPPQWSFNRERLGLFLKALPAGYRYAFEFRDASWFHPDTYAMLSEHNTALSIYQVGARTSPQVVTADYVYIRLYGTKLMRGEYDPEVLSEWAGTLSELADKGKEIFCYFDGDESGCAAREATKLQKLIETPIKEKLCYAKIPVSKAKEKSMGIKRSRDKSGTIQTGIAASKH
jgi:uncharacterized protein YecE (DUF72 family)